MKGDFTRFTNDPSKGYSGVLMQQGRVSVDADWNEQLEVTSDRARSTNVDVIGDAGLAWSLDPSSPSDSFEIVTTATLVRVRPGRAYVDGILVELAAGSSATLRLDQQPFYDNYTLPTTTGRYVVYLDVWERMVDAVEDADIREVALGGPDTATRRQVAWQVKLLKIGDTLAERTDIEATTAWKTLLAGPTGTLRVRTTPAEETTDPCTVPEESGYSGLENQLYRVEIHKGNYKITNGAFVTPGTLGTPTFLWSRENGSVTTAWTGEGSTSGSGIKTLNVTSTGRDENLGFSAGDWVELTRRRYELDGTPGTLARLSDADESALYIDTSTATGSVAYADYRDDTPRVRRWESDGTAGAEGVDLVETSDGWIQLENGVEIRFDTSKTYRTGDWWLIPARSITGEIEWPSGASSSPHGPAHHYAMLAVVEKGSSSWTVVNDLRERVVPLNEHLHMFVLGGQGQSGMPEAWLRAPLRVGVSNGLWPVPNAKVTFKLERPLGGTSTGGGLQDVLRDTTTDTYLPDTAPVGTTVNETLDVETDADGIAQVWWRIGTDDGSEDFLLQRVTASLVKAQVDYDTSDPLHLVAVFSANPSVARDVAYDGDCPHLASADTVSDALDLLCENIDMSMVGGDGQCDLPGELLTVPLSVRCHNGDWGASTGISVDFSLQVLGEGGLEFLTSTGPEAPLADRGTLVSTTPGTAPYRVIRVQPNSDGYASVHLRLGLKATKREQYVVATMLVNGVATTSTVTFNSLILASHGVASAAAFPPLASAETVFEAIELLGENRGLYYVSGTGQVGTAGGVVSVPLRVRVANGSWPFQNAFVQFEVLNQSGFGTSLTVEQAGMLQGVNLASFGRGRTPSSGPYSGVWFDKVTVLTNGDGVAQAGWMLGTYGDLETQRVRASLLSPDGSTILEIYTIFTAQLFNRPITTYVLDASGTPVLLKKAPALLPGGVTGPTPLVDGQIVKWDDFFGLRFLHALMDYPTTYVAAEWYRAVDVEVEVPLDLNPLGATTPSVVARSQWFRLMGSVTIGGSDYALEWKASRPTTRTGWENGIADLLGRHGYFPNLVMLRVVLHPSLMPENLGRGALDIEHRFWLDLTRTLGPVG